MLRFDKFRFNEIGIVLNNVNILEKLKHKNNLIKIEIAVRDTEGNEYVTLYKTIEDNKYNFISRY